MQTIWSRIAQVGGSCRCPQCLHAVHGVSRRAAASATRQAPRYQISSTLWYSGIFAAAATFESAKKERRREQWDKAIAEVTQQAGHPQKVPDDVRHDQSEFDDALSGIEALMKASDPSDDVSLGRRRVRWPANTGLPLDVNQLPPQSIYATEERKQMAEKRRWTPKKLETVMVSMDLLQLRIFLEIYDRGWRGIACAAVPKEYWDRMPSSEAKLRTAIQCKQEMLKELWKSDPQLTEYMRLEGNISLSSYREDDQGHFHDTAYYLNASIQDLFAQESDQQITTGTLLAKLAYLVHTSPAPPNIAVYNTLLLGLSKARQPGAVYKIIECLRRTHIRPNEVTSAAILRHYTAQNDASGFVHWIELMRGKHDGLALARPDVMINDANQSRLVPKVDAPHKVIQLPYPTPDVFGAVIEGVLKFSGFDSALKISRNMGQEGWGLCMSGLTPLLQNCAEREDWPSGEAVWQQIQALRAKSRRFLVSGAASYEKIKLETYATMLRLCSKCRRQEDFDQILEQAYDAHKHLRQRLPEVIRQQSLDSAAQAASAHDRAELRYESELDDGSEMHHVIQSDERRTIDIHLDATTQGASPADQTFDNVASADRRQEPRESSVGRNLLPDPPMLPQEELPGVPLSHEVDDWAGLLQPIGPISYTAEPRLGRVAEGHGREEVYRSWHPGLEREHAVHVDT